MKKRALLSFLVGVLVLEAGCNGAGNAKRKEEKKFPAPGTVVASAEMPVTDDTLNKFIFSVKVVADSQVTDGLYDVDVDFGPNYASGQFKMPKHAEALKPLIKKGTEPYTYIIGFKMDGDTTFYDYYEVSSSHSGAKMQYIGAYSFE